LLSGAYRLSKREIEKVMSDVFNVEMSLGTVCNLENATSKVLEAPVEEAKEYVKSQPVAFLDETGWREAKKKAWMWTAVTSLVTVFVIRFSRGAIVAKELIGETFEGYLHSDRWTGYNWFPLKMRQLCWSHLKRNFQKLVDRGGESAKIGKALLGEESKLIGYWHRVRDGTLKRSTFYSYAMKIRQEVIAYLISGMVCRNEKTSSFCRKLYKQESALWTFTRVEGVEPTNNAAERAVRKPVLWRTGSFGTDSARGSRFVERILSTVATLRAQKRNILEYLVEACHASQMGKPIPSILPGVVQTP
jgi:transposase